MSLLTLTELWQAVPAASSERELCDLGAGLSKSISRVCNRAIAMRVSSASAASGTATLTVPRHGLAVGTSVSLYSVSNPDDWSGVFEIASVDGLDRFTVLLETTDELTHEGELTVRPVIDVVIPTSGGQSVMLDPRPIAEVLSVAKGQSDGTFDDPLEPEDYGLCDVRGGVTLSGELTLYGSSRFPLNRRGDYRSGGCVLQRGARVTFVAGEPLVPADLVYAAMKLASAVKKRSGKHGDLKSMSYDYYSFSRMSHADLAELTGEAESIIQSYKLAVI